MRRRWERDAGLRINHLLLNKKLKSKLIDAGVDKAVRGRPGASDHAPVWVELKPKGLDSRFHGNDKLGRGFPL
jgi:exodeoxyribonuclease III